MQCQPWPQGPSCYPRLPNKPSREDICVFPIYLRTNTLQRSALPKTPKTTQNAKPSSCTFMENQLSLCDPLLTPYALVRSLLKITLSPFKQMSNSSTIPLLKNFKRKVKIKHKPLKLNKLVTFYSFKWGSNHNKTRSRNQKIIDCFF